MNNTDRERLRRLYECLYIPQYSGSQTAPIEGALSYAADAQYAICKCKNILHKIGTGEMYYGEIEDELEEIEQWYSERKSENWE